MDLRLLDPVHDVNRLRDFLSEGDPADYLLEDLSEWIRDGRLWIGEEGGEWVAFGRLHDLGNGEGWVSGLRVRPARRGQGLGRGLLERMTSDARTIGVAALRAVIEDGNTPSRRLFHRFGYRSVADLTLRRGPAREGRTNRLRAARPGDQLEGPVGWLPALANLVDLLPGSDGGRFGVWRPSLLARWIGEGKLFVGPGLAVAVQVDWWKEPRTLWVNPLQGDPASVLSALGPLTQALGHEEWQAFLPSSDPLRSEYARCGSMPHPSWGDRVQLYEWFDRSPSPSR